jgi:hypothetical protein
MSMMLMPSLMANAFKLPIAGVSRRLEVKLSIGFVHPGGFMLGWFMGQMMERGFRRLGCAD